MQLNDVYFKNIQREGGTIPQIWELILQIGRKTLGTGITIPLE